LVGSGCGVVDNIGVVVEEFLSFCWSFSPPKTTQLFLATSTGGSTCLLQLLFAKGLKKISHTNSSSIVFVRQQLRHTVEMFVLLLCVVVLLSLDEVPSLHQVESVDDLWGMCEQYLHSFVFSFFVLINCFTNNNIESSSCRRVS